MLLAAPARTVAPGGVVSEERAGRTDPYRGVAALTHVIAVRA
ncbi:hypothetical protein [Actinoallomurus bryophytorum]|nr:hypothetical protein [Actinoallomurus bryophytorum]